MRHDVHLILDNGGGHNRPRRGDLVDRTPAIEPALHPGELVVAQPDRGLVSRGHTDNDSAAAASTRSRQLIGTVEEYLAVHNDDPKPFVWTATADSILTKVRRDA